jgi:large subunit ribosomal protein L11
MAKKIQGNVRLHIPAGQATPAPPVGPALAQYGLNIGEVTSKFNEATKEKQGFKIPVDIIIYDDRTFDLKLHEPPASELIKKMIGIEKGSGEPNRKKVATITKSQLRQVAEQKMEDLNADNIDSAVKIIEGSAKSMGVTVE